MTPHVDALVRAILRRPERKRHDARLRGLAERARSPELERVLMAWSVFEVQSLWVGPFALEDAHVARSFELPVWEKDGRGPHADTYQVPGAVWTGIVVLGRVLGDPDQPTRLAIAELADGKVTLVEGAYLYMQGSLEEFLARRHREASTGGLASELDLPGGTPVE
jgi:hypothetical protein